MTNRIKIRKLLPANLSRFLFDYDIWFRLRLMKIFYREAVKKDKVRIIDVGGGEGNLERILGYDDIEILDKNSQAIDKAGVYFRNAHLNEGKSFEFPDNTFDFVISFHTVEHIPPPEREYFIMEMIRIAKTGVLINCPFGSYSSQLCQNYLDELGKKGMELNKWTLEHLKYGLPDIIEIRRILDKQSKFSFEISEIRNFQLEDQLWRRSLNRSIVNRIYISFVLPVLLFLYRKKSPSVELILTGSKSPDWNRNLSGKF